MKSNTMFGGSTIAHGTINVEPVLQAICDIQGLQWPAAGTRVDLQFRAPVKPGFTILSNLVVKEKKTEGGKNILVCDMKIQNKDGGDCVMGTAEIICRKKTGIHVSRLSVQAAIHALESTLNRSACTSLSRT